MYYIYYVVYIYYYLWGRVKICLFLNIHRS